MRFGIRILAVFLAMTPAAATAAGVPPAPARGERCGICGMYVAPFPTWVAALKIGDGKFEYFDGPKDMFKRLFILKGKGITPSVFVTDYYSAKLVPADSMLFVAGSDVLGPMGKDLIPVSGEKEASGFKRDHGGKAVYRPTEITEDTIRALE